MVEKSALGEGWTVWNADGDRLVFAYRPDVFDGSTFPAPCLPTVYVARGRRNRRPEGNRGLPPDAPWLVRLRLEPEIDCEPDAYDTRTAAIEGAVELTERFAAGEIGYRSLYQVPREEYLERLDELTGGP
jgi:hypothetical protein